LRLSSSETSDRASSSCDHSVDKQDDNGANDSAYQACALAGAIPAKCLTEKSRNECADDSQDRREDKPRRLVIAGHDELRDDAGDEADNDCPQNAHDMSFVFWRLVGKAAVGCILIDSRRKLAR